MFDEVTEDQFDVLPIEVVHQPTGARFTRFPDQPVMRVAIWGEAASHHEFRKADILRMAYALIERGAVPSKSEG
jgi:hypothetical protein